MDSCKAGDEIVSLCGVLLLPEIDKKKPLDVSTLLILLTKALRSKRREVFFPLFQAVEERIILLMLFEDAVTLQLGYTRCRIRTLFLIE